MNILITGGELFNKGAQSMTFSVVGEINKRYPEAKIYLLSARDARRPEEELSQYKFEILPWDLRMKLRRIPLVSIFIKNKFFDSGNEQRMWNIIATADAVIDISGFCLSSQFGKSRIVDYLSNLYFFKKYQINTVLFPQSFGPFDFTGLGSNIITKMIKRYLAFPKRIYPREVDGVNHLAMLGVQDNVAHSLDTVLHTTDFKPETVFQSQLTNPVPDIETNAVGIVPNQKTFVKNKGNSLMDLYKSTINQLLDSGKTVYLLRHSHEDLSIVEDIKKQFHDNDKVIALTADYSALELTSIIQHFQFMIASRYHAVVHAYKCAVPCLVLGWAVKYQELTQQFEQKKFCFDVRGELPLKEIETSISRLIDDFETERKVLEKRKQDLKLGHLFDEAFDIVL